MSGQDKIRRDRSQETQEMHGMPTALLTRRPRALPPALPSGDAPRLRTRETTDHRRAEHLADMPEAANRELHAAIAHVRANRLALDTVEQEDLRLPSLARIAGRLRALPDDGPGFFVLRGVDLSGLSDEEAGFAAWGIGNDLGRTVRQGLRQDRRLFTVTDSGAANTGPTRFRASARGSRPHTDNACLEPRPPRVIGLLCVSDALAGGESWIVWAAAVHDEMPILRPDLGFRHRLAPGEFLSVNRLVTLHGRSAHAEGPAGAGKRRVLKRRGRGGGMWGRGTIR
ncbi:MAG: TauD/TfdA family dioxygenase [Acetobacteraceae bacterium]|nr:TauD/TfdA family dioxygenase [Acetobacteraceae bacterium]